MGGAVTTTSSTGPWLNITPTLVGRIALSTSLMGMGMFYLSTGRRDGSMNRILLGALLSLASLFCF